MKRALATIATMVAAALAACTGGGTNEVPSTTTSTKIPFICEPTVCKSSRLYATDVEGIVIYPSGATDPNMFTRIIGPPNAPRPVQLAFNPSTGDLFAALSDNYNNITLGAYQQSSFVNAGPGVVTPTPYRYPYAFPALSSAQIDGMAFDGTGLLGLVVQHLNVQQNQLNLYKPSPRQYHAYVLASTLGLSSSAVVRDPVALAANATKHILYVGTLTGIAEYDTTNGVPTDNTSPKCWILPPAEPQALSYNAYNGLLYEIDVDGNMYSFKDCAGAQWYTKLSYFPRNELNYAIATDPNSGAFTVPDQGSFSNPTNATFDTWTQYASGTTLPTQLSLGYQVSFTLVYGP